MLFKYAVLIKYFGVSDANNSVRIGVTLVMLLNLVLVYQLNF